MCCSVLAPETRKRTDGFVSRSESQEEHFSRRADKRMSEFIRQLRDNVLLLFSCHACVKLLFVWKENHAPVVLFATL